MGLAQSQFFLDTWGVSYRISAILCQDGLKLVSTLKELQKLHSLPNR